MSARRTPSRALLWTLIVGWCALSVHLMLEPYALDGSCVVCANGAGIDPLDGRLVFATHGIARVSRPEAFNRWLRAGDGLRIEMWLTPANATQDGPARIVSSSANPYRRNFTVAQDGDALVFRLRTRDDDPNGFDAQVVVPGVFEAGRPRHLVIAVDARETTVVVDGREWMRAARPAGDFSSWNPAFPLLLGNERTGDRPWLGSIDRITVRAAPVGGALVADLDFSAAQQPEGDVLGAAALTFPRRYLGVDLRYPLMLNDFGAEDVFLHSGMMFPLGFLVVLLIDRRTNARRAVGIAMLAVGGFALLTELLQHFVMRTTSVYDLLCGLAGGLAGIYAARLGRAWLKRPSADGGAA